MAKRKSRLERIEKRNATKSAVLYVLLTVGGIFLLLKYGIVIITSTIDLVGDYTGSAKTTSQDRSIPPAPPRLAELPEYINVDKLTVRGNAIAGHDVSVFVNGEKYEVLSNSQGEFSLSLDISRTEPNTIYAITKAPSGLESTESQRFIVEFDDQAPEIELIAPGDEIFGESNRQVKIEGQTEPGASVRINERVAIVRSDGKFDFFTRLEEGENIFKIVATDPAGNETEVEKVINFIR